MSLTKSSTSTSFPIPHALHHLERPPYNLLSYPLSFPCDGTDSERVEAFDKLIRSLEDGNRLIERMGTGGTARGYEEENENINYLEVEEERIQRLYTLVRKSGSLPPKSRQRFIRALSTAVNALCSVIENTQARLSDTSFYGSQENSDNIADCSQRSEKASSSSSLLPLFLRDSVNCHLYILFSATSSLETELKGTLLKNVNKNSEKAKEKKAWQDLREDYASAFHYASLTMSKYRSNLWKCGVPEENLFFLPCRLSYKLLESNSRRVVDYVLGIISATIEATSSIPSTIVAALLDLLHSHEHMAPLVAELCKKDKTNRLAIELLREIGRLDFSAVSSFDAGRASGVKNLAPFINELASRDPNVVRANICFILPHLNSEPYYIRSSVAQAIGFLVQRTDASDSDDETNIGGPTENTGNENEEGELQTRDTNEEGELRTRDTNEEGELRTRDTLFDILTQRVHDISSWTRCAVLKVWMHLVETDSIPIDRFLSVTVLAIDRLQDKTVAVRRAAMKLLTLLLENNPFGSMLEPTPYDNKIFELKEWLDVNLPEKIKEIKEAITESNQEVNEFKLFTILSKEVDDESAREDGDDSINYPELKAKLVALRLASLAKAFIVEFEDATRVLEGMLFSSTTSDVTEALKFFVQARHFKLPCAITGMRKALALMWSSETKVQEEVLEAFVEVFLAEPGTSGSSLLPMNQIAHNFLVLVASASVSEEASIEEAIGRLVKEERIPPGVFLILWSIASRANGQARSAAMVLISMGVSADPGIVDSASRLRLLYEAGLGDYTEENTDWATCRAASSALKKIGCIQATATPGSAKAIIVDFIIERLVLIVQGDWCNDVNEECTQCWYSAAEQAIDAIFAICHEPESAGAEIILAMETSTLGERSSCNAIRLSRLFFVIGHIALKLLVYSEALSSSVQRANAAKNLSQQQKADERKKKNKNESNLEDELGVSDEAEAETELRIAEIAEKEIVGRGLLGAFGPLLVKVVSNSDGSFSSPLLQQCATLALCKFMCVSYTFCEKHLPLLFNAMAKAPTEDSTLRANTIVALGDLAFRFPNAFEPYTPRMYACLRDGSTRVRRHTLMVLTHLILNDMVKVKGQVCEIAMCLEDDESRIRDMSRLLFKELSKRSNNPIYNLLPDMISQLSKMDIAKEAFRRIMGFLLGFIEKDKQNEMLADKICHRFPTCTTISQKADLAFCLAQLKISEKCIKLLNENFKLYKDSLYSDEVTKSFLSIIQKARKNSKAELKEVLDEFENQITTQNGVGAENEMAGTKAAKAKSRASKRAKRNALKNASNT